MAAGSRSLEWLYIDVGGRWRVSKVTMSAMIAAYQAVYFEDVAQAVEYCHVLVAHIVPRSRARGIDDERAVVWFHVPARSRSSTRHGCYLFASAGAITAAQRAGLDTPLSGRVLRASLPPDAVLLFGDDTPPTPARARPSQALTGSRKPAPSVGPAWRPAESAPDNAALGNRRRA